MNFPRFRLPACSTSKTVTEGAEKPDKTGSEQDFL